MPRNLIIASAAYVDPEMQAELGRIPPAFLPIGGRRLFVQQHTAMAAYFDHIYLSVPESFKIDEVDRDLLDALAIEVVPVPDGISLGHSIVFVINVAALTSAELGLLHGDTLLRRLDFDAIDVVAVSDDPPPGYRWAPVKVDDDGQVTALASESAVDSAPVLSGFFMFGDPTLFVQTVTRAGGDFVQGLSAYARERPLRAVRGGEWSDFGHSSTYYRSRQHISTERTFNSLRQARRSVIKSGANARKIEAEARWFETLPARMREFAPAYLGKTIDDHGASYEIQYLYNLTLSDLFVFGRLPRATWQRIFAACDEFLSASASYRADDTVTPDDADGLYLEKTIERLGEFARQANIDPTACCRLNGQTLPSLLEIAQRAAGMIPPVSADQLTLVHGDFCFSNILYDFRADCVRVIDPRGLGRADTFSSYGDIRYDIGKLFHSAVGRYDLIISGYYELHCHGPLDFTFSIADSPTTDAVEQEFLSRAFAGLTPAQAAAPAIGVLLFLSMLPLHSDDRRRQTALLANGLRLYLALESGAGMRL